LAKGGYIIRIRPIAIGILVLPELKLSINEELEGNKYPIPTPIAMAIKIQSVRYWSRKLSFFFVTIKKLMLLTTA